MSLPADKGKGTLTATERAQRLGRLKNAALFSAVIGFGLQVAGTLLGHTQLAQVGMGMFVFGIPVFFIGLYFSRRQPSPAPVADKRPARRSPRRKKK